MLQIYHAELMAKRNMTERVTRAARTLETDQALRRVRARGALQRAIEQSLRSGAATTEIMNEFNQTLARVSGR